MGEFNTVGLEDIIDAFSRREAATVEAVPKMLKAEYGTSSHAARPYMTVANEKAHEKVVEAQRSIWESETGE